jgi:ubiquinone/menaquinone biosynthesis C-methylase UbiE
MSQHAEHVRDAFSAQAAAFEDAHVNHLFTNDASWLFASLPVARGDLLLDVAAGTGHAARELAPHVRAAVALDLTPAMLDAGKTAADERGLRNVVFMRGDAEALPFADASFDVVVTRFALHHIERPRAVLAEMLRCVKPGGSIGVADMIAADDGALARRQNRLEQARDRSHAGMLCARSLVEMLGQLGAVETAIEVRAIDRQLQPWLEQAKVSDETRRQLRAELSRELAGGEPSGLQPHERDGELFFVQHWASLIARKPDRPDGRVESAAT